MKSTMIEEPQVECKLHSFVYRTAPGTLHKLEHGSNQAIQGNWKLPGVSSDNNWSTSPKEPEFPIHCDPYAPSRTCFFLDTPFSKVDLAKDLDVNLIHHTADFEHMIYLLQSK